MRILGIDYGHKRIGLAVCDETETIAQELVVYSPKEFFKNIQGIIKEKDINSIVVGLPLNMAGGDSDKTKEVKVFVAELIKQVNIPVTMFDERLSTQMARSLPGGKAQTDSLAAQIILQNYLNTKNSSKQ